MIFGNLQQSLKIFSSLIISLAISVNLWCSLENVGYLRQSLTNFIDRCQYLKTFGEPWQSFKIYLNFWKWIKLLEIDWDFWKWIAISKTWYEVQKNGLELKKVYKKKYIYILKFIEITWNWLGDWGITIRVW